MGSNISENFEYATHGRFLSLFGISWAFLLNLLLISISASIEESGGLYFDDTHVVEDHLATEHDSEARCVLGEYSAQKGTATN